ncbi:uncharacterized protein N7479_000485 [Penicillium vulpinum]|uniref:uncharacterized protein n=1 Tax=Penicillium vulpinum TaxID=29845 RepID=UPI0025495780|nr:uncharacterized protein N7479_000485 [Penicillium vulpinum]KAJ5970567.1 hypothetical protein N7479_000485 [Penicillium vulpinum]
MTSQATTQGLMKVADPRPIRSLSDQKLEDLTQLRVGFNQRCTALGFILNKAYSMIIFIQLAMIQTVDGDQLPPVGMLLTTMMRVSELVDQIYMLQAEAKEDLELEISLWEDL